MSMSVICPICKKEFFVMPYQLKKGYGKFCSQKCAGINYSKGKSIVKPCEYCGKNFKAMVRNISLGRDKFCCKECSDLSFIGKKRPINTQVEYICKICDKKFMVYRSRSQRGNVRFCSMACLGKFNSDNNKGDKCYAWKGGVTPERSRMRYQTQYKVWRKAVFERDNYSCQHCGIHGVYLHPHHEFSWADFPEMRFNVDNGWTLCVACHGKVHGRNLFNKTNIGA